MKQLRALVLMLVLAAIGFACPAYAQSTLSFSADTTSGNGELTPVLTWSTSPPATSCQASGQWSGTKAAAGSETLPVITSSATYNLSCIWPGDSIATLTWVNPTKNTDGSDYTDPDHTLIKWRMGAGPLASSACGGPVSCVEVEAPMSIRTITGINSTGEFRTVAFAVNQNGMQSEASNLASKSFTGNVTVVESVGLVVNPVPMAPTNLAAE